MTDSPDSLQGLTVREASERLGIHVQTLRGRLRDGEDEGNPLGLKLTGDFGPEWRICPLTVALMKGEPDGEDAQVTASLPGELADALGRVETLVVRLTEAQKARPSATSRLRWGGSKPSGIAWKQNSRKCARIATACATNLTGDGGGDCSEGRATHRLIHDRLTAYKRRAAVTLAREGGSETHSNGAPRRGGTTVFVRTYYLREVPRSRKISRSVATRWGAGQGVWPLHLRLPAATTRSGQ